MSTKSKLTNAKLHLLAAFKALAASDNVGTNFISLPDVDLPNTETPLMVSIGIGTADQTGSSTVSLLLDNNFKPVFTEGSTSSSIPIKPCNELDGEGVLIIADITDTNGDSSNNVAEILVKLTVDGREVYKDDHRITLINEGDTAKFTYKISCNVN